MGACPERPNVLMFIPHDLGEHLCCYGHASVRSPNLDRLAAEGVRFAECFNTAPECTPSRAGLYTGQYTHQNGLMGLCHRGWEFNADAQHLAGLLWEGGYRTYLFGTQHETGMSPAVLGYNHVLSQRDRADTAAVCDQAVRFLASGEAADVQPWFACVGFQDTHRPWKEETSFSPDEVEVPPYLPDHPDVRMDLAQMHRAIEDMDTGIGRVLAALEGSAAADNTLVLYTSDHGIPFPRAKSTFYDPGTRVALIMRMPRRIEGGRVHDQLITNLDVCPTLLEICGVDAPEGLEGRSFVPLLDGGEYEERDAVFGALYYDAFYDPMHMVRTRRHKYIRSFAVTPEDAQGADPEVLAKCELGTWIRADDSDVQRSPAWLVIKEDGPFPPPPREELYDLQQDSLEQHNLADDPQHADTLQAMREQMLAMMTRTNSPLLAGHVPPDLSRTRNQHVAARNPT